MKSFVWVVLLAAVVFSFTPFAKATMMAPMVECWMQVGDGEVMKWWPEGNGNGGNEFRYQHTQMTGMWELTADITVDPDPFVSGVFGILNPTAMTQTYTFTVILLVSPSLPGPTVHGGSTIVTLLDANGDGSALLTTAAGGEPIYMGMIDGVGILPLLPPDVSSLSVNTAGGIAVASKVIMPPSLPSGAVLSSIAIEHKFTLSPGDQATLNSRFEVIPEPATVVLLSLGGLLLRRKK